MPDDPVESPQGLASGREIDRAAILSGLLSTVATAAFMLAEMYVKGQITWDGKNAALWLATFVTLWVPLVKAKVKAGPPVSDTANPSAPRPPAHSG